MSMRRENKKGRMRFRAHTAICDWTQGNRYSLLAIRAGSRWNHGSLKPKYDVGRENVPREMLFTVLCVTAPITAKYRYKLCYYMYKVSSALCAYWHSEERTWYSAGVLIVVFILPLLFYLI